MHTVIALLCFVVVELWLIFPYPLGLLHWHCGNLTIAPVPAKQPWWIWINTSCEFIMNDCITTTKQGTTKPCAYFLGYTVCGVGLDFSYPIYFPCEISFSNACIIMFIQWIRSGVLTKRVFLGRAMIQSAAICVLLFRNYYYNIVMHIHHKPHPRYI